MYDPQAIRIIGFLIALGSYFIFIIACLYGVYLLAKIRTQARAINEKLDEVLARLPSGNARDSMSI